MKTYMYQNSDAQGTHNIDHFNIVIPFKKRLCYANISMKVTHLFYV